MYKRHANEPYEDYFVRLFEHKSEYGLTCQQIADLLNAQNGNAFGECTYRKEYSAFNRGRKYERAQAERGVAARILCVSDLHVPFQLPVETFHDYAGGVVDTLVINGDVEDCQSVSAFQKKYRVNFIEEMIAARQYLLDLIEYIKPRTVYITRGNHEDRLLRYLTDRINDDLLQLMPDSPLDLIINSGFHNYNRKTEVDVFYRPLRQVLDGQVKLIYDGNWHCKVGHTIFAHPLTYSSAMLKTTEKAVNFFLREDRDFDSIVLAHTHKLGQYVQGGIAMYEQGCCCQVEKMNYADGKLTLPQQKGFIVIAQDKDGHILPDHTKLVQLT